MRLTFGWDQTDFTKHFVPFFEIRSGGPPAMAFRSSTFQYSYLPATLLIT